MFYYAVITTVLLFSGQSISSQLTDLSVSELQAVNFLLQCKDQLDSVNYRITSGFRGTYPQGIAYSYNLEADGQKQLTLEVKYTAATKTYSCKLFQ